MSQPTPKTFLVGAGPVATALAGGLRLGGVPVLGLWARSAAQARVAGAISGVAAYSAAPPDLLLESDVVIVAVRDEALGEVASMLAGTGLVSTRHVMLHCSGAIPAEEAFAKVIDRVGGVATLHPLRAISDPREVMRDLPATVFGIEGDEVGRAAAIALVEAVGASALTLNGETMGAYHAAAAMASNYVVAVIDAAIEAMQKSGASRSEARAALVPLAIGALRNAGERGTVAGLTGPIRRGDRATVSRHLQALQDAPELDELYRTLGRRTLALARATGDAPSADLDAIAELLDGRGQPTKSAASS